MHIGKFIDNYLKENNMSQRQFAKVCNLSNGYISMLINNMNPKTGRPLVPSLTALLSISKGMGISLDELINSTDDIDVDISSATNFSGYHSPAITEDYVTFPVIGEVAAGFDHIAATVCDALGVKTAAEAESRFAVICGL